MTNGVLGIVGCPMLEDNLIYCLKDDPEEKDIAIVQNDNVGPLCKKLDRLSIPYRMVSEEDLFSGRYVPTQGGFNMLIYFFTMGLHGIPQELKTKVEDVTERLQPYVDAIGFYLGTCGNYDWDIPEWCRSKGFKPAATFHDEKGNLCHDCVGVAIAGGPKYAEMEKRYPRCMYMFPSMVANYDEFMMAGEKKNGNPLDHMTPDMMEALGIEPGRDGYMRWLLSLGDYQHLLKLDNGIGDEGFDEALDKLKDRLRLDVLVAEPGWASKQPTVDLYAECKRMLDEVHGKS